MVAHFTFGRSILLEVLFENFFTIFLFFALTYLIFKLVNDSFKNSARLPPGPMGLPFLGYIPFLGKEPHRTLLKLSEKYGSIMSVRLGSKLTIVLNDYEVMKETLTHPASLNRAPNLFDHIPELGFITKNGEAWVEQRRFSMQSMRDLGLGKGPWETLVAEEVSSFMDYLKAFKGKPVDISHRLASSINNNILSLLIGRRLQRDNERDKIDLVVNYSDVSFTYMGPSNVTSLMPSLRKYFEYFKIAGYDRASRIISDFAKLIKEEVFKHKAEYKEQVDFITLYLEQKEQKIVQPKRHYFSEENLEGNVKILFLGASDTIFSSLGWVFRLLAEHQDIQKKVQAELDEVIGTDGKVSYEERYKIPYTFSVLMESQRFSSIVPLSTTRLAGEDFQIRGYTIPKGAEIFANLWALHFDPKYWPEPLKFMPKRFIEESKYKFNKILPSYAPFSIGRRNCPGETVAWMEILVFVTSVLQKFTITTPPGVKPQFEMVNGLVAHLKPQPLCFIERTDTL